MLLGSKINLRLVRENDIPQLYSFVSNLSIRGEHFPQTLTSEPNLKNDFMKMVFGQKILEDY